MTKKLGDHPLIHMMRYVSYTVREA